MPLGMEVGLGLRDIVFDVDPATPRKKGHSHSHPIFGPCVLWPNGWMDEYAAWYGSRPRLRPHCTRRVPAPAKGAQQPHYFQSMSIVATVAHLSYCWALVAHLTAESRRAYPGMFFSLKITPFAWRIWTPSNSRFLRPTRVYNANGISIGSTVFAQLTESVIGRRHVGACPSPQNCPFSLGDPDPRLMRGSLGPHDAASQTASPSVQTVFAQITADSPYTLQWAAPSFNFKMPLSMGDLDPI